MDVTIAKKTSGFAAAANRALRHSTSAKAEWTMSRAMGVAIPRAGRQPCDTSRRGRRRWGGTRRVCHSSQPPQPPTSTAVRIR
ncbi:hypothetical protein ACFXDJ_02590 [Streptomyces sp. NPDC059443]|uniref:hypothetical protein n=1 Tax=unclassified Streptomyces TaxID=2593676 RepID=UPI0036BD484F